MFLIQVMVIFLFHFVYLSLLSRGIQMLYKLETGKGYSYLDLKPSNYLFIVSGATCMIFLFLFMGFFPFWFDISPTIPSKGSYMLYKYFVEIGVLEESIKYLVFMIGGVCVSSGLSRFYSNLDTVNEDALKYFIAIGIALGFATFENLYHCYWGESVNVTGTFLRVTMPTIMHMLCGSFMGLLFIMATKIKNNKGVRFLYHSLAIIVPVLFHGFYNIVAITTEPTPIMYLLLFVTGLANIPLFNRVFGNDKGEVKVKR